MTASAIAAVTHVRARILVVDDEADNRDLLEVILAWEGFEIVTAQSGEEALELVASQRPDLVLLDVMMPGMNGYEVTSRLKSDPATRGIPIVFFTAMDDRDTRRRAFAAGAADVLVKPMERKDLCARVRSALVPMPPA